MQNFENLKDSQFSSTVGYCSLSDHAALSPPSNSSPSYLMSSQSTYSPEPQTLKQYTHEAQHNKCMPMTTSSTASIQSHQALAKPQDVQKEEKIEQAQPASQIVCNDEIQLLKQHLKQKYTNYTEQEIEEIIYKFINEYLSKMKSGASSSCSSNTDLEQQTEDDRESLSTQLDWNDRQELEKYCKKQKRIEVEKGFRPSEYFGAITVDKLEDGIDDPKIDQMFSECFGMKPKPKQKKQTQPEAAKNSFVVPSKQAENNFFPSSNQVMSNNPNDQQACNIILNFNNNNYIHKQASYYMQQDGSSQIVKLNFSNNNDILNHHQALMNNLNNQPQQQEDDAAQVLSDKINMIPKTKQGAQILHQEQKASTSNLTSSKYKTSQQQQPQQETLKKYMSPQEIQRLKHAKNQSKSDVENNFEGTFCYKTADTRQHQQAIAKNSQTQMNSPQSLTSSSTNFSKHIQQLSSLIGSNQSTVQKDQNNLSHQSSLSNLNNSKNGKHQQNHSMKQQTFKSILYKQQNLPHHQQNILSISSINSMDSKPQQQSKLSYMSQKALSDQQSNCNHIHNSSETSLKVAPKPPHQAMPLSAKNQRDSQLNQIETLSTGSPVNSCSPKVSPIRPNLQIPLESNPVAIHTFKLPNSQAQVSGNNQSSTNLLTASMDKMTTCMTQPCSGIQTYREQTQTSGANTARSFNNHNPMPKTIGRNNSQNLFKTQNMMPNVQSFLMSNGDSDEQNKLMSSGAQFYDHDGASTSSPLGYASNKNIEMINNKTYITNTAAQSRPQTTISGNYNVSTGMNQYLNSANQISNQSKPPSKLSSKQLGFLSHNSSAKTLNLQSKNLALNAQLSNTMKSSALRKGQDATLTASIEFPKSSRASNHQSKYVSKPASLSRERYQSNKSVERGATKKGTISPHGFDRGHGEGSLENKRVLYKNQKQSLAAQLQPSSKNQSLICSTNSGNNGSICGGTSKPKHAVTRNHNTIGAPMKVNSANMINDYMKNTSKTLENATTAGGPHTNHAKQDSFNRTMQRINKSLDKIKQIFINNKSSQVPPQSTKNASSTTNEFKSNEYVQQINSYKTNLKKTKSAAESNQSSNQLAQKSKTYTGKQQHSAKEVQGIHISIDTNLSSAAAATAQAKKSTENFKKYLSGTFTNNQNITSTGGGLHSFK